MFKGALQEMMNAEFDSSMGYSKYDKKTEKTNYRNGSTKKNLKSEFGSFEFETPRDRNGEFEPKIVPKNTRDVSGIEDKIIDLFPFFIFFSEISLIFQLFFQKTEFSLKIHVFFRLFNYFSPL